MLQSTFGGRRHQLGSNLNVVRIRHALGWFFVLCGCVHIVLAATDPQVYSAFAQEALFPFVRTAWREIFMADPDGWALVVAEVEFLIGAALLLGGVWARIGYLAVITFHIALMMFGWGFWMWSIPAIVGITALALGDDVWRAPSGDDRG